MPGRILFVVSLLSFPLLQCGCGSDSTPSGTARFLFQHRAVPGVAGQFVAVTSNSETIHAVRQQLAQPPDQRYLHINGRIARGNGGHNLDWHWHFVPSEWELAEQSTEVCDGTPAMVEEAIDYWVDQVGRFCPWGAYVASEM